VTRIELKTRLHNLLSNAKVKLKPGSLDKVTDQIMQDDTLVALVGALDPKNDNDVKLFRKIVKGKKKIKIKDEVVVKSPEDKLHEVLSPFCELEEMSPAQYADPVAEVLRKAFEIAKNWDKTWTTSTRKYDVAFGFVKKIGPFLMVTDKQSGKREFFKTEYTGLTPQDLSAALRKYNIRLKDLDPMLDFARKKEGKGQKGVKRTWKSAKTRGGKSDVHARRRQKVPGKEPENESKNEQACPPGQHKCPVTGKCIPDASRPGRGMARGRGHGPMGVPKKP